jgi:MFS transporter, DHA2 family, multidrug resistance protein
MNTYQAALEEKIAQHGEIIRWLIAVAVSLGALLEVVDTSIVNVALPHIQGNLGATLSEAGWVITSYSIANGIMIPLSAWLGMAFGKKTYFVASMIGFTLASVMCGMATNLPVLVFARLLQGLFGGGLLAKAQAILFESFPKELQGHAQGVFGVCVIVGPIIGPTLGGYLTDTFNWRWIFFINIPFGILATLLCLYALPKDVPDKLSKSNVDWLGILLLIVTVGSFQYVLEEGQREDWFASETILFLSVASVTGFILFVVQELTTGKPAVNLRVLRHRSIASGSMLSLVMGMTMYGTMFTIPSFVQTLLGFTAMQSGLLLLPGSIASAVLMPLSGIFAKKGDPRILVGIGTILMAWVMFELTPINMNTSADYFFWPLIVRGVAMVLMYMPLTMATLGNCPTHEVADASGFFNLARQLGGSIGVAAITTLLDRRNEFHRAVLIEKVNPFNPAAVDTLQAFAGIFQQRGASLHEAQTGARMLAHSNVLTQASVMSFEDISWLVGMLLCLSLPLLLLLDSGRKNKEVIIAH